jgi:uncharacterized protein DUF3443
MTSSNRALLRIAGAFSVVSTLGLALACGGGSSGSKSTQVITPSGNNVATLSLNSGITGNYANGVFTSVTVCLPGTSTCQTISDILVDTGSYGLRLLSSSAGGAFNLSLPQENDSTGHPLAECTQFIDGSFLWGGLHTADIQISGEKASAVPINVFGDPAFATIPSSCSAGGTNDNNLQALGANGIIGVGVFEQDCGAFCVSGMMPPSGVYYSCPSTGCVSTFVPLAQQVTNPVALFATDNNGVIIELPSVSSAGQPSATGSIVFGIGTQSNNGLGSAKVISLNGSGLFTTTFKSTAYPQSFVDTGSNGYFFLDAATTGIPVCSDATFFYCPSSTQNLTATTGSSTVNFSVANADNLFKNANNFIFSNLAGPNPNSFDWGLPFFFGRNVFEAIEGKSTPGGTGPLIAF